MSHRNDQDLPLDAARFAAEVEELAALCERLLAENDQLRAQLSKLRAEKAELLRKNQLSQDKIAGMITRLKTLEVEL